MSGTSNAAAKMSVVFHFVIYALNSPICVSIIPIFLSGMPTYLAPLCWIIFRVHCGAASAVHFATGKMSVVCAAYIRHGCSTPRHWYIIAHLPQADKFRPLWGPARSTVTQRGVHGRLSFLLILSDPLHSPVVRYWFYHKGR